MGFRLASVLMTLNNYNGKRP